MDFVDWLWILKDGLDFENAVFDQEFGKRCIAKEEIIEMKETTF